MWHELWVDPEGLETFAFAGPHGDGARALLPEGSVLVWTVEAVSHFDAMTKYYEHIGLGVYTTDFPEHDHELYEEQGWED